MESLLEIQRDLGHMESDIVTVKNDVREVRDDVRNLKDDVQEIKTTINNATTAWRTTNRIIGIFSFLVGVAVTVGFKFAAIIFR